MVFGCHCKVGSYSCNLGSGVCTLFFPSVMLFRLPVIFICRWSQLVPINLVQIENSSENISGWIPTGFMKLCCEVYYFQNCWGVDTDFFKLLLLLVHLPGFWDEFLVCTSASHFFMLCLFNLGSDVWPRCGAMQFVITGQRIRRDFNTLLITCVVFIKGIEFPEASVSLL